MEQSKIVKTFETSLKANIWVERHHIMDIVIAAFIAIYAQLRLVIFFEGLLGLFLFTGIFMLGFVAIVAHVRYYFQFERNRKVELYTDKMVITVNNDVLQEISKKDIMTIILYDRLKNQSKSGGYNLFPTFVDPFYYLVVIGKNQEEVILTCLLDMRLKKKIAAWYGQEPEHKYQFFPFPNSDYL